MEENLGENLAATKENDPNRTAFGYEYLDHTADVQLHAWGPTLKEAFEQCAKAMFGYMTDLETVSECRSETISVQGHDLESTLYNFMDEWLYQFSAETFFIPFKIEITKFERGKDRPRSPSDQLEVNEEENIVEVVANGFGETFDLKKHPQGTEVKAITYSAMQINENPNFAEVFVIIDI